LMRNILGILTAGSVIHLYANCYHLPRTDSSGYIADI
jgi:hypothetical protein